MTEATYDPEKPLWSIMTKSHGGTVSVIRDLTLDQARRTYERLDPWYGHHSEQFTVHKDFLKDGCWGASSGGCVRSVSNGDIEVREVFGPHGWTGFGPGEIKHWPTITSIYTDDKWNILPDEYQEDVSAAQMHRQNMQAETRTSQHHHHRCSAHTETFAATVVETDYLGGA